jgi:hypothetical protein
MLLLPQPTTAAWHNQAAPTDLVLEGRDEGMVGVDLQTALALVHGGSVGVAEGLQDTTPNQ